MLAAIAVGLLEWGDGTRPDQQGKKAAGSYQVSDAEHQPAQLPWPWEIAQ
jgi:hypothetical protein